MPEQKAPEFNSSYCRWRTLRQLEHWLDRPMLVLSFVWLALALAELTGETNGLFEWVGTAIWIVFIADFALRLFLAPDKRRFLLGNWVTLISLVVPALRVFRFARALQLLGTTRGLDLVRIVGSMNRGMNALRKSLGRRRVGYVLLFTVIVTLVGAAGMLQFEGHADGNGHGFDGYSDALWWTAMLVTTIGSQYWPVTSEGRILAFLLSIYSISVFGYLTAVLATFFIGRDAEAEHTGPAGQKSVDELAKRLDAIEAVLRPLAAASQPEWEHRRSPAGPPAPPEGASQNSARSDATTAKLC